HERGMGWGVWGSERRRPWPVAGRSMSTGDPNRDTILGEGWRYLSGWVFGFFCFFLILIMFYLFCVIRGHECV
ncbi:hypothetical protein BTE48_17800, partial [Oceanospirillum multiglobuliferum]